MKTTNPNYIKENSTTNRILLVLLLFSNSLISQSWQWLKAGGNDDSADYNSESIKFMDSDSQGNVYVAFEQVFYPMNIAPTPFTISGYQVPHYSTSDAILASFACDGTLRWTVAIGGEYTPAAGGGYTSQHSAQILGFKTDAQGNIYVTGIVNRGKNPSQPLHFSSIFTVPASAASNVNKEQFFIAKYNSNGVVQWVRFPEGPNVVLDNNSERAISSSMAVDPDGTIHIDGLFSPGSYCNGAFTVAIGDPSDNGYGLYRRIIKYDTNGNYIGNAIFQYVAEFGRTYTFLHDHNLDRYYIEKQLYFPEIPEIIGGQVQTKATFVAAFDSNGSFLWKKEDANSNLNSSFRPDEHCLAIDNASNLYMNNIMGGLYNSQGDFIGINDWNGQQIPPIYDDAGNLKNQQVVVKMDSNGNTLWIKNNTDTTSGSAFNKSVISGNELVFSIAFQQLTWDGLPQVGPTNVNGGSPGIFRLNKDTGVAIGVDYLYVGSDTQSASSIAAGLNGSYYIGGAFQTTISTNLSGAAATVTTGGYDDFFIAKFGNNNCTLATTAITPKETLTSYPNPVATLLHITNQQAITYTIYDALGKMVQMDALAPNGSIDLQNLTKGIYLLQMKDENGTITTQKIIKD